MVVRADCFPNEFLLVVIVAFNSVTSGEFMGFARLSLLYRVNRAGTEAAVALGTTPLGCQP